MNGGGCLCGWDSLAEAWQGLCMQPEPFDDLAGLAEMDDHGEIHRAWQATDGSVR